mgnify:CR=1 FL=1
MPQLNFEQNFNAIGNLGRAVSVGTLSFIPFSVRDSISFVTMNIGISYSGTNTSQGQTYSIGLYSLNASSLSLANSISGSTTATSGNILQYISMTATSATQNVTPGNWWFGILVSTTNGTSRLSLLGGGTVSPANAFPGSFIGGRMTDSTNALPSSIATSALDITGSDAMNIPMILLSA